MNKKIIGYILIAAGLVLFALSYPAIRALAKIPLPAGIKDIYIMIAGISILFVGAFIGFRKAGAEHPKEIPIYEGHGKERKIVGIQRVGK